MIGINQFQTKKGFTLVEVMVVVSVFSVLFTITTGLFSFALKTQRNIRHHQEMTDQLSYAADIIASQIRDAKITPSTVPDCVGGENNYSDEITQGDEGIRFYSRDNLCVEIYRKDTVILVGSPGSEKSIPLTPKPIFIEDFKVTIQNPGMNDLGQARVTFMIRARGPYPYNQEMTLVRTVSQRNLNIGPTGPTTP